MNSEIVLIYRVVQPLYSASRSDRGHPVLATKKPRLRGPARLELQKASSTWSRVFYTQIRLGQSIGIFRQLRTKSGSAYQPAAMVVLENWSVSNTMAGADITRSIITGPRIRVVMVTSPFKLSFHDCYSIRTAVFSLCDFPGKFCQLLTYKNYGIPLSPVAGHVPQYCPPVGILFPDRGFADNAHDALVDFREPGCTQ
jgi:hypothetical protein